MSLSVLIDYAGLGNGPQADSSGGTPAGPLATVSVLGGQNNRNDYGYDNSYMNRRKRLSIAH